MMNSIQEMYAHAPKACTPIHPLLCMYAHEMLSLTVHAYSMSVHL